MNSTQTFGLATFKVTPHIWGVTAGPIVTYVNLTNGRCTCSDAQGALCAHFDAVAQSVCDEAAEVSEHIRRHSVLNAPVASNA